ncbi:uro-adherence factor A-like isoform X5 [Montipora capricornis]|uniref:uro-adherence factor A-like isoform X5 n=1 Tax=Montipora capricornis TaxID=246305 RepID=UPI0035F1A5E3
MGWTAFCPCKKSSKRKNSKDKMVAVEDNSNSVEMKEFASSSVPIQGTKHVTLPTNSKDMDPKGAASLLENRRVSASVSEIRDLYSALQELVPGNAASSLSHQVVPEEENPRGGVSSNQSSPRPRRRSLRNSMTEQGVTRSTNSEEESLSMRVRRLLPVLPHSPSSLRKFNPKNNQALDVNDNQSATKGKRTPDMERRGSSGEVTIDTKTNPIGRPNMGRRVSSGDVLLGGRNNENKEPKTNLAMVRSASSIDIYRGGEERKSKTKPPSLLKLDRFFNPRLMAGRGSEGLVIQPKTNKQEKKPSPLKMRRSGSSSDTLETETTNTTRISQSPLTSPSQNEELTTAEQPQNTVHSSPRQKPLKNALNKFSEFLKEKTPSPSPEPKEPTADIQEAISQSDVVDGLAKPKPLIRLESQMDLLLNSLNDLQGSPKEKLHVSNSDPLRQLDQRRASLGTEMQKLLGALKDLCPSSDSDSLGEHELRSRNGSVSCERMTVERESLDELEAYFTGKLRDATKAGDRASKTPSERSSECEVVQSDKEDGEGNETSLVLSNKRTSLIVGSVDEGIDLTDHPINTSVKRPQSQKDRDRFANQVNKKLQDWLEKAMILAQKEKENLKTNENFTNSESEEFKFDSHDSDESDSKDKEPQKLRRNLFNKLSFLRRGEKSRWKHRHRRTRSMHDVTISLEKEQESQDGEEGKESETTTADVERKSSTVTRSRSMHTVVQTRNKHRSRKEVNEAEDVMAAETDTSLQSTAKGSEHARAELGAPRSSNDLGEETAYVETPKGITTPRSQQPESKNLNGSMSKKRLGRLPTDLPLFYHPREQNSGDTQENPQQTTTESPSLNRKKLFSQNGVIYTGMEDSFYTEKKSGDKKLKKTASNAVPYPRILVNESSNYFFGDRYVGEVTLVYPSLSPPGSLRRCTSMDSFLHTKDLHDCQGPESSRSYQYGNDLLPDDAGSNHMFRPLSDDQAIHSPTQAHIWDTEVTI